MKLELCHTIRGLTLVVYSRLLCVVCWSSMVDFAEASMEIFVDVKQSNIE